LIDFGTLVPMGAQTRIAGTPPFVPPEAFYAQPLDGRCDLYALGALGYFLLTQTNAFPARELFELPELWQRRPPRPDSSRPELPRGLCDLVMSMITLDPRARPASASEVYERLSALAQLPVEDEPHLAQAFLSTPSLVGRDAAQAVFTKRLMRASTGRGNSVAVVARAGLGRSRILANVALQAKISGAVTVMVGATAVGSGPRALAGAIAERLLEAQPSAAKLVSDLAGVLANVSPALRSALGDVEPVALPPLLLASKLNVALVQLVERVVREHTTVIVVDDLHRADADSLWVLGRIALAARRHRMLLVSSCDAAMLAGAPPALAQLVTERHRVVLEPLDAEQTRELLASLFEDVPGLLALSRRIYELSQGNPAACMQYAQYLVDRGIARYEGGSWSLPAQVRGLGLPANVNAMLEQAIAAVSGDARALALGLALARDRTRAAWQPDTHIAIEDFPALIGAGAEPARAFSALDELLRAALVQDRDGHYVLAQDAISDVLVRMGEPALQQALHARLAEIFARQFDKGARFGWLEVRHLLLAQRHDEAMQRAISIGERISNSGADWGGMRLSLTADCADAALAHWKSIGGGPRGGLLLRRTLLLVCSVYDWQLSRHGAEQLAQLQRDCGLDHWRDPELSAMSAGERIGACLTRAQARFDATPADARGFAPLDALRELAGCALALSGSFVNAHDVAHASETAVVLEPLAGLAPVLALLGQLCQLGFDRVRGLEAGDKIMDLGVTQLFASEGLSETLRTGGAGVNAHIQTVEDARRGRERGLQLMDLIAAAIGDDMFLVVHGRWLCHAFRGRTAIARRLYPQVELITEDDVWRRRTFMFAEAELHALTGDQRSLQRVCEQLQQLAAAFPGWLPWSLWAHAEWLRLRGENDEAKAELARALTLAHAGTHRAWIRIAPSHAELQLACGDAEAALRETAEIVEVAAKLGLDRVVSLDAERVRALAHARLGQHTEAAAAIARAVEIATQIDLGGLPRARLYHAEADVALSAGDDGGCIAAMARLWSALEHAEAPALAVAYEGLRIASSQRLQTSMRPALGLGGAEGTEESSLLTAISTQLTALPQAPERAQRALDLLLKDSGSTAGHLFLFTRDGVFEAASSTDAVSGERVRQLAEDYIARQLAEVKTVTATDMGTEMLIDDDAGHSYLPVLLSDQPAQGGMQLVGLLLVATAGGNGRAPHADLRRAVGHVLHITGDTLARDVED
jgi:tetratricopeptide (TPR) repeat protein